MKQQRIQSNTSFLLMALEFRLRDRLRPPVSILQDEGVTPGMTVLDYGCGPGGFAIAAAKLVGPAGLVYAFDIHPLALRSVKKRGAKESLTNLLALHADQIVTIPEDTVDVALLHDVLHDIAEPDPVLRELSRVLKPSGILCVRDHELKEDPLRALVMCGDRFWLVERSEGTYKFGKAEPGESQA